MQRLPMNAVWHCIYRSIIELQTTSDVVQTEVHIAGYPAVAGCYWLQPELKNGRPVYRREPHSEDLALI